MIERIYVWGIDPALSRLAFAFAEVDSDAIEVETLVTASDTTEGERLGLLDRQVRIYARQIASTYPPAVVWVEQPSGRFRNLPLAYACGVIQAALFETLGVPVWTIPSSAWKLRTDASTSVRGGGTVPKGDVSSHSLPSPPRT